MVADFETVRIAKEVVIREASIGEAFFIVWSRTFPTIGQAQEINVGRIAGIDYGSVRIGIALSDPEGVIASPWRSYQRMGEVRDAEFFRRIASEEKIDRFVVGLPVHCDGRESTLSRQARQFARWLERTTGLPVELFDERFTSVEADEALWSAALTHKKRKARRDMVAAQMMLAAYLEWRCNQSGADGDPTSPLPLDG